MSRIFMSGLLAVGAVAVMAGSGAAAPGHHDDMPTERGAREAKQVVPRLVVSDGLRGRVAVVDLASRRVLKRFTLAASASLTPAGDGRHVLAAMGDRNRVRVIDGGSWSVPHGDHDHHYVRAPRGRAAIAAKRPSHVVSHGSRVAIFGDGDGVATVIRQATIARGARGAQRVRTGAAHHGVAVPLGTRTVVSVKVPGAKESLPGQLAVANPKGRLGAARIACPAMHGEAALSASRAIFACADGYVMVDVSRPKVATRRIAPAPGIDPEARSFTVASAPGLPYAIGDLDETNLVRIDPATRTSTTIPLPAPRGAFALDAASRSLLVVGVDGVLRQINPATGAVRASVAAVTPFTLEGGFSVPRPTITVGPERRVYVSDPAAGRVVEVATNPLRVTRAIRVGGTPVGMAVLGTN